MKKLLFLFLAISIAFVSCDKEDENVFDADNIIGSWECSRVEVNGVYEATASAFMQALLSEYTFNEDGSGTETILSIPIDITWTLTTAKVLTISTDSDVDIYNLEEFTDSKFVYKSIDENDTELTVTYTKK
ncbi:MAG: hypothetical protein KAR57_00445 [Bacteroidales bacterium]|nr:hypothetical protein [Bacteroidales bacterium]